MSPRPFFFALFWLIFSRTAAKPPLPRHPLGNPVNTEAEMILASNNIVLSPNPAAEEMIQSPGYEIPKVIEPLRAEIDPMQDQVEMDEPEPRSPFLQASAFIVLVTLMYIFVFKFEWGYRRATKQRYKKLASAGAAAEAAAAGPVEASRVSVGELSV
jgi:hypothetical protein